MLFTASAKSSDWASAYVSWTSPSWTHDLKPSRLSLTSLKTTNSHVTLCPLALTNVLKVPIDWMGDLPSNEYAAIGQGASFGLFASLSNVSLLIALIDAWVSTSVHVDPYAQEALVVEVRFAFDREQIVECAACRVVLLAWLHVAVDLL